MSMSRHELLAAMSQSIIEGDAAKAVSFARETLERGLSPLESIQEGYVPGIHEVGRLYETGEYFLPDLVMAGEAMKAALHILEPEIRRRGENQQKPGRVLIGSVEGDIHEIGKNLVAMMLNINGFEVVDLGVDVRNQTFVEKACELGPEVIGMSALLTTTMLNQKRVIETLKEAGVRDRIKVIVGGSPVTASWAEAIGADGYAGDAVSAVALVKNLLGLT